MAVKSRAEVTPEKLRGGFYTPPRLVQVCLERVASLVGADDKLRLLEPSAGDGAFVRALASPDWERRIGEVLAIEPLELEAEKCRGALRGSRLPGHVIVDSAIRWSIDGDAEWDVAVGNPPFVRYQFISASDRAAIRRLGERLGVQFSGVSNLWIPVLLGALSRLRSIPTNEKPTCPTCRGALVPWTGEITSDSAGGPCPKCGGQLEEDATGERSRWD